MTDIKTWLESGLKYLALITFIFTVFMHFDDIHLNNRRLAMGKAEMYIRDYTTGDNLRYNKILADFWREKVPAVIKHAHSLTRTDADRIFQYMIYADHDYKDYDNALSHILLHLDLVTFCTEQQLCDRRVIAAFYCGEYRTLRSLMEINRDYYVAEGIVTGTQAEEYFDDLCLKDSSRLADRPGSLAHTRSDRRHQDR
jgi:hypothetical protein